MPKARRKFSWFDAASGLFALSLALPAVVIWQKPLFGGGGHLEVMFGFHCLMIGWVAIPTWIANPLFAASVIFLGYQRRRTARVLAALAIVAALISVFYLGEDLRALHVGYYVWLASMIAMLIATYERRDNRQPTDELGGQGQ